LQGEQQQKMKTAAHKTARTEAPKNSGIQSRRNSSIQICIDSGIQYREHRKHQKGKKSGIQRCSSIQKKKTLTLKTVRKQPE
jgi:hypothetical protein